MPPNLSRDDCDQRTEWRLTHIKEHLQIHLQITLRAARHLLRSYRGSKAQMTRRSDVIKAERSACADRVKLEETGEVVREIMNMSALRFRLVEGFWLHSCVYINRQNRLFFSIFNENTTAVSGR